MEEGWWSGPNVVCSNSFPLLISEIQDANCFYYLFWNQPKRLYLPQTINYFGFTTLSIAVTKTFHRGVVCPLNLKLRYALLSWFECRKYSGNALDLLNLLCYWPRKFAPSGQPIIFKINLDSVFHVFPRFKQLACFHFEFSLANENVNLNSDWSLGLFWFFDTQLRTTLLIKRTPACLSIYICFFVCFSLNSFWNLL